ncbi:uncharacterized protein COLE_03747 [Cutaneotrichosporon oleaginosum]|nr:hypothetical protein COLE_03747 [Cutaneotrichosporon oleaginosum]
MSIQCSVCKQAFQSTSKRPMLEQHVDSKHSKQGFATCFPNYTG